jgi:predicted Zn-dependent protease
MGGEPLNLDLPDMGDPTGTLFTPQQEKELGEAFFRNLHNQTEISEDPEITDYIQSLGQKLVEHSDTPGQAFHFFVVKDPNINAFAGPGGYIGVNSGLILTTESESELASVMGHEIAHVTQRHLYQTFQAASRMSIPTAVGMLAAALLGAAGGGQAAQAAMMGAMAASSQFQINFTRDNEAEADRVGMKILASSQFDPRSMPLFFERMQQSTRFANGNRLPEFLLTHPVTVSRISDTRGRAEQYTYKQYPDSFAYQLTRAKLRVATMRSPGDAVNYFKSVAGIGTPQQQDVSRYGLALAQVGDNQIETGKASLQKLVQKYPEQANFYNALAEAEYEAKHYDAALELYRLALQRFPDNQAMLLNQAIAYLRAGRAEEARHHLINYSSRFHDTPDVYALLAEALSKLGREAESHRYIAEYYYLAGQPRAAIMQLQLALKTGSSNQQVMSTIHERLRVLLEEENDMIHNR